MWIINQAMGRAPPDCRERFKARSVRAAATIRTLSIRAGDQFFEPHSGGADPGSTTLSHLGPPRATGSRGMAWSLDDGDETLAGDDTVLVDFGIAKEFVPDGTTTAFRTGSPGFAAPEQYSRGTSTRSDIYGLGATMYILLTGTLPADALDRMTKTSSGEPDPLIAAHMLAPNIPQDVSKTIARAMARGTRSAAANWFAATSI